MNEVEVRLMLWLAALQRNEPCLVENTLRILFFGVPFP
jgi:hypothetical protein